MGSTTIWGTGHLSAVEFVKQHVFTPGSDKCSLIDISVKNNVAYCAVQIHNADRIVFALIVKLSKDHGDWNYRDMDEGAGPYYWDCPSRILDKLSPTDDRNSLEWRHRCRERLEASRGKKQPQPGDTIRLNTPIRFSDGVSESVFLCELAIDKGPRLIKAFRRTDGVLCKINGLARMSYTVETKGEG